MAINNDLKTIETKLNTLKTNLDGYLTNKGATAGANLTESVNAVDTIQTGGGGGGNPFDALGYPDTPQYIKDGIAYGEQIKNNWDPTNTAMNYMFSNDNNLTFMPVIDTSNVNNMNATFRDCSIQYIWKLDTHNVENMSQTFTRSKLVELPLIDTGKVIDMSYMFMGTNIISIPLFNTGKVTNMANMFKDCKFLNNIPALNTSNVTDMSNMFTNCRELYTLPAMDTSKVNNFYYFLNNTGINTIEKLDWSSATNLSYWISISSPLKSVNIINMGMSENINDNTIDFKQFRDFGNDAKISGSHKQLIDILITNSFDRAAAGYTPITLALHPNITNNNVLSEEEKAAITAKGYTIA